MIRLVQYSLTRQRTAVISVIRNQENWITKFLPQRERRFSNEPDKFRVVFQWQIGGEASGSLQRKQRHRDSSYLAVSLPVTGSGPTKTYVCYLCGSLFVLAAIQRFPQQHYGQTEAAISSGILGIRLSQLKRIKLGDLISESLNQWQTKRWYVSSNRGIEDWVATARARLTSMAVRGRIEIIRLKFRGNSSRQLKIEASTA